MGCSQSHRVGSYSGSNRDDSIAVVEPENSAKGGAQTVEHKWRPGAPSSFVVQSALYHRSSTEVNQYRMVSSNPIGKGFQSKVYLVEDSSIAQKGARRLHYAMKVLDTQRARKMASKATDSDLLGQTEESEGREVWIEVQVAQRVQHQNIVRLCEVITEAKSGETYLIMELMAKAFEKNTAAKREQVRRWGRQLLDGLVCLHNHKIVHRDIKVDNCLLSPDGQAKLGDFGLAHLISNGTRGDWLQKGLGSRKYRAPEVVASSSGNREGAAARARAEHVGFSGFQADVWAMGCVFFSLVAGRLPFDGRNKTEQCWNIMNQPVVWPRKVAKDPQLHDLLERMLERDPSRRISATQASKHNWFARVGWHKSKRQMSAD